MPQVHNAHYRVGLGHDPQGLIDQDPHNECKNRQREIKSQDYEHDDKHEGQKNELALYSPEMIRAAEGLVYGYFPMAIPHNRAELKTEVTAAGTTAPVP